MTQPLYTISGVVIHGMRRGAVLGFPTANIMVEGHIPAGIYVSKTTISTQQYPSVTFVGVAETFGESDYKSETYVLDYSGNLYTKEISVQLLKKIRESEKFTTVEALVEQMKEDVVQTRAFFTDKQTRSSRLRP